VPKEAVASDHCPDPRGPPNIGGGCIPRRMVISSSSPYGNKRCGLDEFRYLNSLSTQVNVLGRHCGI
jgi:hypothetical protein